MLFGIFSLGEDQIYEMLKYGRDRMEGVGEDIHVL